MSTYYSDGYRAAREGFPCPKPSFLPLTMKHDGPRTAQDYCDIARQEAREGYRDGLQANIDENLGFRLGSIERAAQ